MRKFLVCLALLISTSSFAFEKEMDWIDHYVLAQEAVGRKDGNTAIAEFSRSIELQPDKLFLYVQRAQIHEKKHQWEEAVRDYTYVIDSPNVHPSILLHALYGRGRCYVKIDGLENYLLDRTDSTRIALDWNRARAMDTSLVHTEENENYSIEWNVSQGDIHNPEFKKEYSKIMVKIGDCQSTKDVKFFDNWTIINKLKKKKNECKECHRKNSSLKKNTQCCVGCGLQLNDVLINARNPTTETDCTWWCDKISTTSMNLCYTHFKSAECRYLCTEVVKATKKGCYICCTGDGFYKNCVKPFENFLERVGCQDAIW